MPYATYTSIDILSYPREQVAAAVSLAEVENEIRRRFLAAASDTVAYREAPTVGSDRDVMSFFLEWKLGQRMDAIAVHLDFLNNMGEPE